jgi:hypothetical protein
LICFVQNMSTKPSVSVTRKISVSPGVVWALVTDLLGMGEWSPENQGGEWIAPSTGPAVGATFKGRKQNGKNS